MILVMDDGVICTSASLSMSVVPVLKSTTQAQRAAVSTGPIGVCPGDPVGAAASAGLCPRAAGACVGGLCVPCANAAPAIGEMAADANRSVRRVNKACLLRSLVLHDDARVDGAGGDGAAAHVLGGGDGRQRADADREGALAGGVIRRRYVG